MMVVIDTGKTNEGPLVLEKLNTDKLRSPAIAATWSKWTASSKGMFGFICIYEWQWLAKKPGFALTEAVKVKRRFPDPSPGTSGKIGITVI